MTAQGTPLTRFRRAIEQRSVFLAELAAREAGTLSRDDALSLVLLYAADGSPKFERAAVRLVGRVALDADTTLADVQLLVAALAGARTRPDVVVPLLRRLV
ncbi:MAG TPA: hypothetical protein VNT58_07925 [Gaiellaceae bacterium]|nr:hypothetical protein [Gaiellaceae bacterium]